MSDTFGVTPGEALLFNTFGVALPVAIALAFTNQRLAGASITFSEDVVSGIDSLACWWV